MENVAMLISGGVDSSVSTHLLVEQGYKPDLFYIKIGMDDRDNDLTCTMEEDLEMASSVAHKYGLKLETIDLQQDYWDNVVKYTIDTVAKGFTPNPDIFCNKLIKFGTFNTKVGKNYDRIATGHYATTIEKDGLIWLGTGVDLVKDQTDFLCQLDYSQLSKAMFPIGHLPKSSVREIATNNKLVSATRKDSQGICFLGKINYNDFLNKYLGKKMGDIIEFETGKVLGKHNGYYYHTIGQRKGLGLSGGPWFVCKKSVEDNIIYVTKNPNFKEIVNTQYGTIDIGTNINWITKNPFYTIYNKVSFKIRHSPNFSKGILYNYNGHYYIKTDENIGGVAAGQYCVIYDENAQICYGSGEIQ